jgi:[ribosomal protein S5]-alanine N-acetyltransferase
MDGKRDSAGDRPQPAAQSAFFGGGRTPAELAGLFDLVRTERLVLRRPTAEDGPAMFAVHGDPRTNLYNPAGPDPDLAASEETLRAWLRQWDEVGVSYWVVTLPTDGEVIGFGGVRGINWSDRDVLNLYYRFTPVAWGHGYATETARAAVELAREHLSALPIVARVRTVNIASARTAERAGLVWRPDLDDEEHMVFALGWM